MKRREFENDEWMADAACSGEETELFFAPEPYLAAAAMKVCDTCPVTEPCLKLALENDFEGVWGGMLHKDRRMLRSSRVGPRWCKNPGCPNELAYDQPRYCSKDCYYARRSA